MKIIVSIVSHGHQEEIAEGGLLASLDGLDVAVRENKAEVPHTLPPHVQFFHNLRRNGFGTNHNKTFEVLGLADDDWFVICNPDILTDAAHIRELVARAEADGEQIATPYLHNEAAQCFDHNVRRWPSFMRLLRAFLKLGGKSRYSEEELRDMRYPDWCSGALVAFRARAFRALNGFDEDFFMYMEDVDLGRRAAHAGVRIRFYRDIVVVHNAARASGSLLRASFRQHLASIARYVVKHRGFGA